MRADKETTQASVYHPGIFIQATQAHSAFRLRNDIYCVGWGVKLYSLTHPGHASVGRYNEYRGWFRPSLGRNGASKVTTLWRII